MFSTSNSYAGPLVKNLSIRSLRYQSHPLTRLVRDSLAPTLQSVMVLLVGLAVCTLVPNVTATIDIPQHQTSKSN
jgi:hypothetical protein